MSNEHGIQSHGVIKPAGTEGRRSVREIGRERKIRSVCRGENVISPLTARQAIPQRPLPQYHGLVPGRSSRRLSQSRSTAVRSVLSGTTNVLYHQGLGRFSRIDCRLLVISPEKIQLRSSILTANSVLPGVCPPRAIASRPGKPGTGLIKSAVKACLGHLAISKASRPILVV